MHQPPPAPPRKKKGFLDGYKTDAPAVEGCGGLDEWRATWEGMTEGEARDILGSTDPLDLLGLPPHPTADQLKSAYRKKSMESHPDHGGSAERFHAVHAAYMTLKDRR